MVRYRSPRPSPITLVVRIIALLLPCGLVAPAAAAEDEKSAVVPPAADTGVVGNFQPTFAVPRVADGVRCDGVLDEPQWQQAVRLAGFTQWNPDNLAAPPVDTEVLVAYDSDRLLVGLIAYDDPRTIRASLRDRDQIFQDDFIGLFLDPIGDGSWAYELWSNPIGVQGDILWTPNTEDTRFDIVYETGGKITERGYQVEMAIPFNSLRFPNRAQQTWRVNFWRNHPRDTRGQYSWAAIRRGEPCWQCQWGTMTGIENVRPSSNLELLPSLVASHASALSTPGDIASGLDGGSAKAELGLNARYVFASNMTAEAAVNPDFSQIESDATQIDVNSSFALFYPERRPFFQEGNDLFQTPFNAVYTRSINDPSGAGRFTGRPGRTSVAYVGAVDEHSPFLLPFEERSAVLQGGRSVSNIARVQQTFGDDNKAGLLFTDRRHEGGGSGTTMGLDGAVRLPGNLKFQWQGMATHTEEPVDAELTEGLEDITFDGGRYTAVFDGESFWGHSAFVGLNRNGRVWNMNADAWEKSPTFRAENGFEAQNNIRHMCMWNGVDLRPKDSFFTLITPNVHVARVWNFDGVRKDEWVRPELYAQFKGQTDAWIAYIWSSERYRGHEFGGIRRFQVWAQSRFSKPVSVGYEMQIGRFIARNIEEPVLGRGVTAELWGTIKPLRQLVIEPTYQYSELRHPETDAALFAGYILRMRAQYQFTRELFFRLIVQYDAFADALQVDPLLSYKLNPFTVGYAGSTHSYLDGSPEGGFSPTDRQIFVKLQYLFRI